MSTILEQLFFCQDLSYKKFAEKLVPDTSYEIIGVRAPIIKKIAKEISLDNEKYMRFINMPHKYYEECLLHGAILGCAKLNISDLLSFLDCFMPNIDNWCVCDCTVSGLKIFKKHKSLVLEKIKIWLKSDNPYSIRFALVTLLNYYLGDDYNDKVLPLAKSACCDNYYVNMAVAWLISVALVKNYQHAIKVLENNTLPKFVHNKSIQKAKESFRISEDKKIYLNSLRV